MSTTERPPVPGLTRENTGYPHDVYRGWFLTPEGLDGIERREAAPLPPAPPVELTRTCVDCRNTFPVYPPNTPTRCGKCRRRRGWNRLRGH